MERWDEALTAFLLRDGPKPVVEALETLLREDPPRNAGLALWYAHHRERLDPRWDPVWQQLLEQTAEVAQTSDPRGMGRLVELLGEEVLHGSGPGMDLDWMSEEDLLESLGFELED